MTNQVLTIEQMRELIKLGIDTSKANIYWHYGWNDSYSRILPSDVRPPILSIKKDYESITGHTILPTFTLQDILNIISNIKEYVWVLNESGMILENLKGIEFHREHHNTLLQSAFEMLKWCKQNNFI